LSEKLNVIYEVEAKSVTSRVKIVNRLGFAPSSLSRILLNSNIIEGEMKCGAHSKKSMNINLGASEGLKKILLEWFHQICFENVPIS
jgi:hypothetical protein